jgi:hypothetical protein
MKNGCRSVVIAFFLIILTFFQAEGIAKPSIDLGVSAARQDSHLS